MEIIYATLLLHSAKKPITFESIKSVLEAAGVQVEEGKIKALISSLENVDINKAIEEAKIVEEKPKEEEKKEEKKEEEEGKKLEEAAAGLSALFG